jgi:hypothetical protein
MHGSNRRLRPCPGCEVHFINKQDTKIQTFNPKQQRQHRKTLAVKLAILVHQGAAHRNLFSKLPVPLFRSAAPQLKPHLS